MNITGNRSIPSPRERVWDALNDPAVLQRCLPGCESVVRAAPERFELVMAATIGPLRARFNGQLHIDDATVPASCTLRFEGQGGAVGFGRGSADVWLDPVAEGTELRYSAQAQVGGKLAQVGSRLIESVARKMVGDFFEAFTAQLAAAAPAPAAAADLAPRAVPHTPTPPKPVRRLSGGWLLAAALAGALAAAVGLALAH